MKNLLLPVEYQKCHMTIRLPEFLKDCTLANKKKIFRMIFEERYRNEETIRILNEYIPEMDISLREKWHEASHKYQNEYRDPTWFLRQNPNRKKEVISIKAKNKRMLNEVVSAKKDYERFQKVIDIWNKAKTT